MGCKNIEKLMQVALAGEINASDRDALEQHIIDCAKCSAEYLSLKRTVELASTSTPPELTPEEWRRFRTGLRETIESEAVHPDLSRDRIRYSKRKKIAPALAMVAILIGIALFVFNDRPSTEPASIEEDNFAAERSLIKQQIIVELELEDLYSYDQDESDLDDQLEELEWLL